MPYACEPSLFFFFNDTATTEIYTLSLHDALPICGISFGGVISFIFADLIVLPILNIYRKYYGGRMALFLLATRSEEHTSELQSQSNLVCRLLLEKKKIMNNSY